MFLADGVTFAIKLGWELKDREAVRVANLAGCEGCAGIWKHEAPDPFS